MSRHVAIVYLLISILCLSNQLKTTSQVVVERQIKVMMMTRNPGLREMPTRLATRLLMGEWVEPEIVVTLVTLARPLLAVGRDLSVLL